MQMPAFIRKWGEYPPEYDRAIHGQYNPSVYYGKRDIPLSEVKLSELGAWIGRRNKSPNAMVRALSRAYWRHHLKWMSPIKPGPAGFLHYVIWMSSLGFLTCYPELKHHKQYRYH